MMGFAGSSYALFAVVWGAMCLLSGALVTDTMLRSAPPAIDSEGAADVAADAAAAGR